MNRCITLCTVALAWAGSALAQNPGPGQIGTSPQGVAIGQDGIVRQAPKDVRPARLVVTQPPEITVDGKADRLSPGARIRNLNNLMVLSASLVGKEVPVVYRRDAAGLVHEVWLLTEDEYAKLGGGRDNRDPNGVARFNELLALIFAARR